MYIEDSTGTIDATTKAALESQRSTFDLKVVVTSAYDRPGLDAYVGRMVTSANTLAVGVDPVHHYTFTHFGVGTGIRPGDFQMVAHAGNGEFHAGRWGDGVRAIVASANAVSARSESKTAVVVQHPVTVVEKPVPVWPFVVGFAVLALVGWGLWRWLRRRQRDLDESIDQFKDEAQELRARNIEENGWHEAFKDRAASSVPFVTPASAAAPPVGVQRLTMGPPIAQRVYAPASYAPIATAPIIVNPGSNGLLEGMIIGQALSRPSYEPERHYREPTPAPSSYGSGGGSYDSGSSSYDSGSSFDSGSSGGDFGGGGGFDGGGGGGDF